MVTHNQYFYACVTHQSACTCSVDVTYYILACACFHCPRFKLCANPKGNGFILLYYKSKKEKWKHMGGALQLTNDSKVTAMGKVSEWVSEWVRSHCEFYQIISHHTTPYTGYVITRLSFKDLSFTRDIFTHQITHPRMYLLMLSLTYSLTHTPIRMHLPIHLPISPNHPHSRHLH